MCIRELVSVEANHDLKYHIAVLLTGGAAIPCFTVGLACARGGRICDVSSQRCRPNQSRKTVRTILETQLEGTKRVRRKGERK
jgi:hypothetical protein